LAGAICGDAALPGFFLCPAVEVRGEEGVERWSCLDGTDSFFGGSSTTRATTSFDSLSYGGFAVTILSAYVSSSLQRVLEPGKNYSR
jgi:hypothetical protein